NHRNTRHYLFKPWWLCSIKYYRIMCCRLCPATAKSVKPLPATRISARSCSPVPPRLVKLLCAVPGDMKRVTLELGGNDAGIVLDDINVEEMADDIFWGAFINTGQTCAALKRLYVPASIY